MRSGPQARRGGARGRIAPAPQFEGAPQHGAQDCHSQRQVSRQPVLADIGALAEPAHHHVPAERALQPAQHEDAGQAREHAFRDRPEDQEHREWNEEGDADEPAQESVRPFPPVDHLEFRKAHAAIDDLIFGDLPVFLEGLMPIRLAERRDGAEQRLPLGDR
jgi:hypothetical protein